MKLLQDRAADSELHAAAQSKSIAELSASLTAERAERAALEERFTQALAVLALKFDGPGGVEPRLATVEGAVASLSSASPSPSPTSDLCSLVECAPESVSECRGPAVCDPVDGRCKAAGALPKQDGTVCDDGDSSTDIDTCADGVCRGEDLCDFVQCAPESGATCANGLCR